MLTPDRIKEKTFQTTGRGSYRAEDVDSFLREVSASYEQMFKENTDLIKKISVFAKKIEEYRADEDSLKMALLNAQKLADKIVAEAKETAEKEVASVKGETDRLRAEAASDAAALELNAKNESEAMLSSAKKESSELLANAKAEAEKLIEDATKEAKEILGNINRKVTHESLVYEMMQKESTIFKQRLVSMYKEHINLINKLPEIVDEKLDEEATQEETAPEVVEAPVEETPAEEVVVVEETPVVVEEVVEEEIPVIEEEEIVVIEEPQTVVEETPVVEEPVVQSKPSFSFDINNIDFSDDDEPEIPVSTFERFEMTNNVEAPIFEENDDDNNDSGSISFKNFFKKK